MSKLQEFIDGDRPEDVALYLSEAFLEDDSRLWSVGTELEDGVVLVVDGETGRSAFAAGTGMDAMEFAQTAMGTDGEIHAELGGGDCPNATESEQPVASDGDVAAGESEHRTEFVFAFVEEQNEEVGGLYAEGAVLHAYAHCACGTSYSDRWVVDDAE